VNQDERETIPPQPPDHDTDVSMLAPDGDAISSIASRLSLLPEILEVVNKSARDMNFVTQQMQSLGTAFENLSREIRYLTERANASETRLASLERRVKALEDAQS
jgi:hypothetical protein